MPILMHPTLRSLHNPAIDAQAAAVRRIPFGQKRSRSSGSELATMRLGVVATIALHALEAVTWTATLAADSRDRVHQREQLRHVMTVGSRQHERHDRSPAAVDQQVVLGSAFAPIDWIWACFFPPCIARIDAESMMARDQSILSAALSLSSSTWCSSRHTPAAFQSRSRRQQVMPQPQF